LGEEGYKQMNQLMVKEAVRFGFARPEMLSSDTTVQEPLIGYPHEAGILRQVAQRVARVASKLKKAGIESGEELSAKVKEVLSSIKHYYLFAKQGEEKTEALKEIVSHSEELMSTSQEESSNGFGTDNADCKEWSEEVGGVDRFHKGVDSANQRVAGNGESSDGEIASFWDNRSPCYCEKQSREENGVWFEVVDKPNRRRLCVRQSSRGESRRKTDAARSVEELWGIVWEKSDTKDERVRPWREFKNDNKEIEKSGSGKGGNPAKRENRMVSCRGRPKRGTKSKREDRRRDWHIEEQALRLQWWETKNKQKPESSRTSFNVWNELDELFARLGWKIETSDSTQSVKENRMNEMNRRG
jgi:hypothetical protein